MKLLYKKISQLSNHSATDLPGLINSLKEPEVKRGAYYCSFLTFIEFYRITIRTSARSGISSFFMHITIADKNGDQTEEKRNQAATALNLAIQRSLREGDIYTQNGANEFLLLLMGISQENCPIVFGRIQKAFQKGYSGKGIRLQHKIALVSDMSKEESHLRFSISFARELDKQ